MNTELMSPTQEVFGLLDQYFNRKALVNGAWAPAVDIQETAEELVVQAALPGVRKEDVDLEVKDDTLILSGERKTPEGEDWLRRELPTGSFYRAFSLPAEVEPGKVKAAFRDGILEVRLAKAESAKPHKVKIE